MTLIYFQTYLILSYHIEFHYKRDGNYLIGTFLFSSVRNYRNNKEIESLLINKVVSFEDKS